MQYCALRGISEVGLGKLSAAERKSTVVSGLKALSALNFFPEQTDALLYYTKAEAAEFSAEELKLAAEVRACVLRVCACARQVYACTCLLPLLLGSA